MPWNCKMTDYKKHEEVLPGLDKDPSEQVLEAGDGGGGMDAES